MRKLNSVKVTSTSQTNGDLHISSTYWGYAPVDQSAQVRFPSYKVIYKSSTYNCSQTIKYKYTFFAHYGIMSWCCILYTVIKSVKIYNVCYKKVEYESMSIIENKKNSISD